MFLSTTFKTNGIIARAIILSKLTELAALIGLVQGLRRGAAQNMTSQMVKGVVLTERGAIVTATVTREGNDVADLATALTVTVTAKALAETKTRPIERGAQKEIVSETAKKSTGTARGIVIGPSGTEILNVMIGIAESAVVSAVETVTMLQNTVNTMKGARESVKVILTSPHLWLIYLPHVGPVRRTPTVVLFEVGVMRAMNSMMELSH